MENIDCECKKSTSSIDSMCIECGGDMHKKWAQADKELREYHNSIKKEKCSLCNCGMDFIMYEYTTYRFCTNKQCSQHVISLE